MAGSEKGDAAEGRELYEAVETAVREAQRNGASVPFETFLERIELLLGRELNDDEVGRITTVLKEVGWLHYYGKTPALPRSSVV